VLTNLLANAIKFTPAGGLIETRLLREAEFAVIEVSDTGEGISPQFLPHVFDRRSQATERRFAGLGLGLAIVKHIVELHGGSVAVKSEGEGKGSTFAVRLPCAP
jgi:signal transduction histidine kinase